MKPNKRYLKKMRKIMSIDDRNVLFRQIMQNFSHIEGLNMSIGYYSSVELTCHDGKRFLSLPRDHWQCKGCPYVKSLRIVLFKSSRYYRNK